MPPPPDNDSWTAELSPGAAVDLKHEGGWWECELISVRTEGGGEGGG